MGKRNKSKNFKELKLPMKFNIGMQSYQPDTEELKNITDKIQKWKKKKKKKSSEQDK